MFLKRSLLTAIAAGVVIASGLPAVTAHAAQAAQAAPSGLDALAVRTTGGTYDVTVNGDKLTTVAVSDPAFTTAVFAHPNGRQAAVITDFDGTSGRALQVVSKSGSVTVHTGRITSAAWSAKSRSQLAYIADGVLRVADRPGAVTLGGPDPSLLGWSSDGKSVYVLTYPGGRNDAAYVPSVVRVDPATGAQTTILRSDPWQGVVLRDVRLVTVAGEQMLSYVKAQHVYPCGGKTTSIGLADMNGKEVAGTATTTDTYRSAVFSPDGRTVAVERQVCVSKTDTTASPALVDEINGVYVIDVAGGNAQRLVRGLSANFPLAGFDGDEIRLASSRFGDHRIPARAGSGTATPDAATLDAATAPGGVSIQAKIVPNRFIHQLWDTRNEFNGNSACGPTSAVMDLAGYQLRNEWGIWVDSPSRHYSPFGLYITNTYSINGYTFNRAQPDAGGRGSWTGAYGWMVLNYTVGTYWSEMTSYLQRNGATVRTGMYDANWIRARLNEGYMVVTSGSYVFGRFSHIALITGYTDDGRFYVNDPYGNGTDGSFDGQNSLYTWDYIRPKNFWAA